MNTMIPTPRRTVYCPDMGAGRIKSRARIHELMRMLSKPGAELSFESPAQHLPEIRTAFLRDLEIKNRIAMFGILCQELDEKGPE